MKKQFYSKLLFLFALLLTVSTSAWADEVTINYDSSFSPALPTAKGSVHTTATEHTVSGINIGEAGIYKGSSNNYLMFVEGKGFIYNTESLGNITSVAVTYTSTTSTSGKVGVYFGSTVQSSYVTTSNKTIKGQSQTDTWTNTGNDCGYFQFSTSYKNVQVTKIVITYTPSGAAEKADNEFALVNAPIELNFDLYPNPTAQVINYTTSSTGAVTVIENEFVETAVDETNKTITVTPKKKTPSAQTITVSQAADDNYKAGEATFEVSITDSTPVGDVTEETINISDLGLGYAAELTTYEGKAVTLTWDKGSNSNTPKVYENGTEARFYKGNTLTFNAVKAISQIEFTYSDGYDGNNFTASTGTVSGGKWTGNADEITLTNGASDNTQIRYTAIKITYADESDTRLSTTTTIDGTGITNNNVFSSTAAGQLVATVSTEDNVVIGGAAITWSGNNDEVATIAADGTVTLVAAGEVTFTATYEGDETNYKGSAATYKMTVINKDLSKAGATAENPYTVAQAIEAIDTDVDVNDVYATGIVSEIVTAYNSQFGNISYNISADGTTEGDQLQAYRGKSNNGENFTSADDIKVGDKVVIHGNLIKYGSTYEFAAGNQLVSLERVSLPEVSITAAANATWVAPANVEVLSEDVTVYTVEYIAAKSVVYKHEVTDKVIPANKAVLLTSKGATPVTLEITAKPATKYKELANDLKPSDGTIQGENIYCLADGDNGLGFYPVHQDIKVPAGKAYLLIPATQAAPSYLWFNGDTTAIDSLTTDTAAGNENGEIYSLTGQRVGKNYRGIVIMNGRKVLKK